MKLTIKNKAELDAWLREKLEGVSDKWELRTVWSVGYKFEVKE